MSIKTPRICHPAIKQGDTYFSRVIARLTNLGLPVRIYRARMELRTATGELIYRWATDDETPKAQITGDDLNEVTLLAVSEAETVSWPIGNHVFDVEVWLEEEGSKITILEGTQEVKKGVTQNA